MLCETFVRENTLRIELRLNPCYSGICSVSHITAEGLSNSDFVLILVIVEYAL